MICISINQESRRLALADMVNAKHFGDLLEIRLDRFGKSPDIGELLTAKPRPVLMTCRRPDDGGCWDGTEQERLSILRECIISKADYVEIEIDAADDIRPYPPSKRVISYTNLRETPGDILDIYEEAKSKKPDVIKLMTLARTPEEAWPLVQILAKATVPTVVASMGKLGVMLAVLGKKIGAWAYAALERGMEAYPGQPTVSDLTEIYRYHDLGKTTKLIGVTGFEDRALMTAAALNAVFASADMTFRCLPMAIGNIKIFRKIMESAKLAGAVIDVAHQAEILDIQPNLHGLAQETHAADVLIYKNEIWHGMHVSGQAWTASLKETLQKGHPGAEPLKDRFVLIVGLTPAARVLAAEVQRQGSNAILASNDRKAGQAVAQVLGCRFVAFDALYTTMHDVLVVCDEEKDEKNGKAGVLASYLKPGMTVMDLTADTRRSVLLREAEDRACAIVSPLDVTLRTLELQAKALTGKPVPRSVFQGAIPERFLEEE